MLRYKTFQFYEFYYMLWNREDANKKFVIMLKTHYYPMFLVMKYIQYHDIYEDVRKIYCSSRNPRDVFETYEETIEIDYKAITGIKITYDDPVNCLMSFGKLNVKNLCKRAALRGHVKCLDYLYKRKCDKCYRVSNNICYVCDPRNIQTLMEKCDCGGSFFGRGTHSICVDTLYVAVGRRNNMKCIKYMHENKCGYGFRRDMYCYFHTYICNHAAESGNLEYIKYYREHGGKFDRKTLWFAIKGGDIECVKYLLKENCEWNNRTWQYAVDISRWDILQCLYDDGLRRYSVNPRRFVLGQSHYLDYIVDIKYYLNCRKTRQMIEWEDKQRMEAFFSRPVKKQIKDDGSAQ